MPADSRGNDRWFQHLAIIVSDMDRAYAHLRRHDVEHASTGPQTLPEWNVNAAGIRAFYFRDPDGHFLEILQFPPGKGDARWHRETDRLFLGVDHTAIVVADTGISLGLYRDTLGLRVVGESENYGTEQEHLNNVFGARLRITTLRAAAGPAVELLEYLAPRDGRPTPADTRANDLWHWHVRVQTADTDLEPATFRAPHATWVSPGPVAMPDRALGLAEGMMWRDRDGHAILIGTP
jgi:catechol 2,3-dioxygenase-like lactoylglutathione lyase family enzyme